ncbi:hypothetical protein L6164_006218 [Bauhinia variegata]|uniref:Uncharacterized protein n=1 Tax=Bauhinia variegata TaxID=167791 RepID=A0ACB9PTS3_BAUVA|nr:hypothetical protein L6164_006218 [Bauhinia variegata]
MERGAGAPAPLSVMEGKEKWNDYKVGSLPTVMYIPNFITDNEQTFLLNNIYGAPQSKWKSLKNRRLQNWGGVVHEKGLLPQDLPPWLTNMTHKICEESGLFPSPINHVLINEYLPNQGIMPHQDGPAYFPVVAILSLGSPVVMDFTPHSRLKLYATDITDQNSDEGTAEIGEDKLVDNHRPFSVLLMPRSLLIFKDNAYSDYLHGIKDSAVHCYDGAVNETEALKHYESHHPVLSSEEAEKTMGKGESKNIQRTSTRISLTCLRVSYSSATFTLVSLRPFASSDAISTLLSRWTILSASRPDFLSLVKANDAFEGMNPYFSVLYPVILHVAMPAMKKNFEQTRVGSVFNKLEKQLGDPVDFKLPEWFNKWKPMPYTFIKRNIYLTKRIKRRVDDDDGIFCACTPSPGSSSVCGRDCQCGMLQSSCSSSCKCGDSCLNKPFHNRPVKKMKLVQTEKCGSGIVADEDIKQGEFVIEYVGEVIDDKTCEERLWDMKHRGETNFYLCEINRDMVIDATYKGNKSRYINHSCCPNTEMQKWIIDGETRIGIFAKRDIRKGEHLTYDYKFVQFGADQDCHCGAAGCRRKLGARPTKPKTSSDAALKLVTYQVAASSPKLKVCHNRDLHIGSSNVIHQQNYRRNCIGEVIRINRPTNERCFGIIKRYDKYTNKHKIMFEDGGIEFLDMSKEDWELVR